MSTFLDTTKGQVELITLIDGYSKGIPQDGPFISKRYMVPWDKADAVSNRLMGISSSIGTTVGGTILRVFPHICPESNNLVCVAVGEIEGCGEFTADDGPAPKWEWAIVPAAYGFPRWNFGTGEGAVSPDPENFFTPDQQEYPFATFTIDYSKDLLSMPGTSYKFFDGPNSGKHVGTPVHVRITTVDINCSIKMVPWLPVQAIMANIGKVNSRVFLGAPIGSILFDGAKTTTVKSVSGSTLSLDLDLTFRYRSRGWNMAPNPYDGDTWNLITADGTLLGATPYASADLRPLLFGATLN